MRRETFIGRWAAFLAALVILLGVTGLLADRFDVRVDLTEGKLHTISPQTEQILEGLRDKVTIRYYVSSKLPPGFENLRRDAIDYLEEYSRAAGGMVEIQVVDPYRLIEEHVQSKKKERAEKKAAEDEVAEGEGAAPEEKEDGEEEAGEEEDTSSFFAVGEREALEWAEEKKQALAQEGIPELRGQSIEDDRFEIANFYSSIEIRYLDREPEVITVHQSLNGFEYELAMRIVKLTMEAKPKVAFLLGKPDDRIEIPPDPNNPFQQGPSSMHPYQPLIRQVLAPQFEVVEVELAESSPIPEEAELLIVAEPHALTERQVYEIDRSIARGRSAIILASHTSGSLDEPQLGLAPLAADCLAKVFEKWGFSLGREIICSESRGNIEIVEEGPFGLRMRRPIPFALCPLVRGRGLHQESPLTQALQGLVFPFASEIRPNPLVLEQNGLTFTALATTERSWLTAWRPTLDRGMFDPPLGKAEGEYVVAALLEGTFPTAFAPGSPLPKWSPSAGAPPTEGGDAAETPVEVVPELAGAPGRVIVIGSADFAKVTALQMYGRIGSIPFLLSAVETMALGQDLVRIRAKAQIARPLRETTTGERNLAKYGNLLGVSALILVLALGRHFTRRSAARAYEARFAGREG